MARDCTVNKDPNAAAYGSPSQSMAVGKGGFDSEYASLMAELGETGKSGGGGGGGAGAVGGADLAKGSWAAGSGGHDITGGGSNIPPWRRPEVWQTNVNQNQNATHGSGPPSGGGYRAPQQGYGGYGGYDASPQAAWGGYQQQPASYQAPQDYNYAQYYQNQYAQQTGTPTH